MRFHLKAVSFASLFATLAGTIKADCTQAGGGSGPLNIKCKSYPAPTQIGQTVNSDLNALSVEYTAQAPSAGYQYYYKNNENYDIHFGIQYYNPTQKENWWQTWTITANSDCFFNIDGHMENFKLTC